MRIIAIATFFIATSIAPHSAIACDCPVVREASIQARWTAEKKSAAVKVRITRFSISSDAEDDPVGIAVAEVVSQPTNGNKYPLKLIIRGRGGDEGANCGGASALFEAVSSSRNLLVSLSKARQSKQDKFGGDEYFVEGCGIRELDSR